MADLNKAFVPSEGHDQYREFNYCRSVVPTHSNLLSSSLLYCLFCPFNSLKKCYHTQAFFGVCLEVS